MINPINRHAGRIRIYGVKLIFSFFKIPFPFPFVDVIA